MRYLTLEARLRPWGQSGAGWSYSPISHLTTKPYANEVPGCIRTLSETHEQSKPKVLGGMKTRPDDGLGSMNGKEFSRLGTYEIKVFIYNRVTGECFEFTRCRPPGWRLSGGRLYIRFRPGENDGGNG